MPIKPFLDDASFLLDNPTAEILYHATVKDLPVLDYHNHLSPYDIAADRQFANLTDIWLRGDHYKWRAMRAAGVPESFITGEASDAEKFGKWAEAVPLALRNPLFHWTHLELRRYFGITDLLNAKTAADIYHHCNELLQAPEFSARNLLRRMNVEALCTTDDPADDLRHHQQLKGDGFEVKVLPTFRPDKALLIENQSFAAYIEELGQSAGMEIQSFDDLLQTLKNRAAFFADHGCKLADHGLEQMPTEDYNRPTVDAIFKRRMAGQMVGAKEAGKYMSALLYHLSQMYADLGWVQQFHLGALRNNNTRLFDQLGADAGCDSIGDFPQAKALAKFLDRLDREGQLAKTILYNLNPRDNELFATMAGNFQDGSTPGKVQYGAAWWFLDQLDGMEKQLNTLSNMGLLGTFVGMLTDSRSFLSFPRHEYFRRLLCNLIGRDVHEGKLPNDPTWLGEIVRNICYFNAKNYFHF